MWNLRRIKLKNVGPFKSATYEFSPELILVQGLNLHDEGQISNGSGKSFLTDALSFALIGEPFRKISSSDLISENESYLYIELDLFNSIYNQGLKIERSLELGKSQKVIIDGGQMVKANVSAYNEYIYELLGVSKEDISNYFLVHKDKYQPIFALSDTEKKKLIQRFTNSLNIEGIKFMIEQDLSPYRQEIDIFKETLIANAAQISLLEEQIKNEEAKDSTKELKEREAYILKLNQEIILTEEKIQADYQLITSIEGQSESDKVDLEDTLLESKAAEILWENNKESYEQTKSIFKDIEKELDENISIRNKNKKELVKLQLKLTGFIQCPECNHSFTLSPLQENLDLIKNQVKELEEENLALESIYLNQIKPKLDSDSTIRQKLKDILDKQEKLCERLQQTATKLRNRVNSAKGQINSVKNEIQVKKDKIENIKQRILITQSKPREEVNYELINNNEEKISWLKQSNEDAQEQISNLEQQIYELTQWNFRFEGFKNHLINKTLKVIEGYINYYLAEMGTNLQVLVKGDKQISSGASREEIDFVIFKDGENKGSYFKFSSGEKARLNIASIAATQKLINLSSHKSGGLNFLIMDEIMESLDEKGLVELLNCLKKIENKTICFVTHNPIMFSDISHLTIIKNKGQSIIVNQSVTDFSDAEKIFENEYISN